MKVSTLPSIHPSYLKNIIISWFTIVYQDIVMEVSTLPCIHPYDNE
jgi:hypothetical protein